MEGYLATMKAAASGMAAQGERLRVVSENVANADTPGYRRKLLTFETAMDRASDARVVEIGALELDQSDLRQTFDPAHPMADERGYLTLSNVNLVTEIADAREAQRSFEANVQIFDQARRMYSSVLQLLKR